MRSQERYSHDDTTRNLLCPWCLQSPHDLACATGPSQCWVLNETRIVVNGVSRVRPLRSTIECTSPFNNLPVRAASDRICSHGVYITYMMRWQNPKDHGHWPTCHPSIPRTFGECISPSSVMIYYLCMPAYDFVCFQDMREHILCKLEHRTS